MKKNKAEWPISNALLDIPIIIDSFESIIDPEPAIGKIIIVNDIAQAFIVVSIEKEFAQWVQII